MSITYEQIRKANDTIKTTDIKGKDYAEVNQRIKAFRMVYPTGFITDELLSNENGVAYFKATVGYYMDDGTPLVLGTGYAFEKESSSYINKTSYIENGDTSAIGRALGMAGFGIDVAVASFEEVANAINNQQDAPVAKEPKQSKQEKYIPEAYTNIPEQTERKATPKQIEILANTYTGDNLAKLLGKNGIEKLEDMPMAKASELIEKIQKRGKKNG